MLTTRHNQSGTTLIELLIGLVVFGILIAVAMPAASSWTQSAKIRNAAEAIQNGLQLAVANAVSLNDQVQFRLQAPGDSTWVVGCATPSPRCPAAIQAHSGPSATVGPGAPNTVTVSPVTTITFNGFGRVTPPGASAVFAVQNPTGGSCLPGGSMRCLNVVVSPSGEVRMCDPVLPAYPNDPQGC